MKDSLRMSLTTLEFDELLSKVRNGDEEASAKLIELYEADILIIAKAQLGAPLRPYIDSLDLVQSVHRSLLVGLRANRFEFTGPDKLVALAATMLRRKIARHWRKLRRQQRESGIRPLDSQLPDLVASITDSAIDPAEEASFRDQIAFALGMIEGIDRELVVLRLDGYSTADASRRLGIDEDVARVRLSRLRRRLKDAKLLAHII